MAKRCIVGRDRKIRIMRDYIKLKKIAKIYISRNEWENALKTMFVSCGFMYTLNQIQQDAELESMVESVTLEILKDTNVSEYHSDDNVIVYYDSYGSVTRGLTKIYLKALKSLGYNVKYVTANSKDLANIKKQLGSQNVFCIKGKEYADRIKSLSEILIQVNAKYAFLYLTPDDLVAIGVFAYYKDCFVRYLINQTDHAFWIGKNACDIVINFREFGGKVCKDLRGISEKQIAYLPYYPEVEEVKCEGLDIFDDNCQIVFSGGALYKTESEDNQYYRLVKYILDTFHDVKFVYMGTGGARKMRRLVKKYSSRVYFSGEKKEFYEIMKRCVFYLSTYPYNGGLMTQYALLAQKVPVTLNAAGIEKELSIQDENSFWNFGTFEECITEINKLLSDDGYRKDKEKLLQQFLISSNQFEEELKYLVEEGKSVRSVNDGKYEMQGFINYPLEYYKGLKYYRLFFRKKCLFVIKKFPLHYLLGGVRMIIEKICK